MLYSKASYFVNFVSLFLYACVKLKGVWRKEFEGYAATHLVYGEMQCNFRAAVRKYAQNFQIEGSPIDQHL